jgi:hypothetical protein
VTGESVKDKESHVMLKSKNFDKVCNFACENQVAFRNNHLLSESSLHSFVMISEFYEELKVRLGELPFSELKAKLSENYIEIEFMEIRVAYVLAF